MTTRSRSQCIFALAVVFTLSLASRSDATIVGAQSDGEDLVGARLTVHFAQQGAQSTSIVSGGPGVGFATLPNLFTFSVSGDTFLNDWKLSNDTTFDEIFLVEFDLSSTSHQPDPNGPVYSPAVLFDDNSSPSTPDSFAGRNDVVYVAGPAIIASNETDMWTDAMNLGDEYVKEFIEYDGFGPGQTSVWRTDTDIVGVKTDIEFPEPTTATMVIIAGVGIAVRTRRR